MNDITKLAIDLTNGNLGNFSAQDANETLRQAFIRIFGSDKPSHYQWEQNKNAAFQIISESIGTKVVSGITNQFEPWVEVRNTAYGDSLTFDVENPELFKFATVSAGNGELRSQRTHNGKFTVATAWKGVKIREEFERFLAGRIDWDKLAAKLNASVQHQISLDMYNALWASFSSLSAPYQQSGVWDEAKLITICSNVEAANQTGEVAIIGTKGALSRVVGSVVSENMKDQLNNLGHYGKFRGYNMFSIKQAHLPGTNTFAIDDRFLLVVPTPADKMIKLVLEGNPIVSDTLMQDSSPADLSKSFLFLQKYGVGIVAATRYGIYRIS